MSTSTYATNPVVSLRPWTLSDTVATVGGELASTVGRHLIAPTASMGQGTVAPAAAVGGTDFARGPLTTFATDDLLWNLDSWSTPF